MADSGVLSLFPARVAIVDQSGVMTPEFYRALSILFQQFTGMRGDIGPEVFASFAADGNEVADVLMQPPAATALAELLLQPVPAQELAELVMQPSPAQDLGEMLMQSSGTATSITGGTAGAILYQSAANVTGFSAAGTAGQVLLSGGTGAPTWTVGTLALAGNFTTAGAYPVTFTFTAATGVTFPTTGNLVTEDGAQPLTNKTELIVVNPNPGVTNTATLVGLNNNSNWLSFANTTTPGTNEWDIWLDAFNGLEFSSGATIAFVLDQSGAITTGVWNGTPLTDAYLATISTAGKVSNSATTAASANTASAIVARDGAGNFSAGTVTAALAGNATTATTASSTTAAATFNNGGAGAASGTTFDGSTARTISYNTIGAPKTDGTNASGTWGIAISGAAGSVPASGVTGSVHAWTPVFKDNNTTAVTFNIIDAYYVQIGNLVYAQFSATRNDAAVLAGSVTWSVPVAHASTTRYFVTGNFWDVTTQLSGQVLNDNYAANICNGVTAGAYLTYAQVANGNELNASFTYIA